MNQSKYSGLVTATISLYGVFAILDFVTSMILLLNGYVELNPLYGFLGLSYWTFYWILTIGFPVLLLEFGNRWAFLYMWVPTAVHFACVTNNFFLGVSS